ncbi:hypothetical protein MATL_G00051140 [Megalops atlanticus]|uniref:C-type lectin domain-containing protein n=1 Tax=Megalops atlanticus TaxID=7932 RepID=A0A9D3TIZ1_MEGAT|nr:hypothetical protein MATL_G00051140 [Megalops atlanticus]
MSEGVLYSALRFKKNMSGKIAVTQDEYVTYSEVKIPNSPSPHTVSHYGMAERSGQSSHAYRLAAVCLGLLCAFLLTAIIALCVYNISLSQKYSAMEQLRANYSTLTELSNQLQRVLQKLPFLHQNCSFISQKRVCQPCPQGWEQFNSKCYYFSPEWKSWPYSRIDCLTQGADLVTIDSEDEQEFITKHTKEGEYLIGLSDSETEGTWLWVDRTPIQKG